MHEPIIDMNLWNTVQEMRQTRRKASSGKNGKKHPLSGKVYCEKCGSKMYKCTLLEEIKYNDNCLFSQSK